MRRLKRRPEPVCTRCGNEEDLFTRPYGTYCKTCLHCPHDTSYFSDDDFCYECYYNLYTVLTFEGYRILDMELYVLNIMYEYGQDLEIGLICAYDEADELNAWIARSPKIKRGEPMPPPHHRARW